MLRKAYDKESRKTYGDERMIGWGKGWDAGRGQGTILGQDNT